MAKKQINKNKIDKKISNYSDNNIKGSIILVVVIIIILILFYLLTVFILNKKEFVVNENVDIQYSKIIAGESFDLKDEDYLVFFYDISANSSYTDLVSTYRDKDKHLPIYTVDLGEGINNSVISDTNSLDVSNIIDLKVKDSAIIRIKNGKVSNYATSSFEEFLDNNIE